MTQRSDIITSGVGVSLIVLLTACAGIVAQEGGIVVGDALPIQAALGGLVGGAVMYRFFGHPGLRGVIWSLVGAIASTFLAAVLAGLFMGGLIGALQMPLMLLIVMSQAPLVLYVWMTGMAVMHGVRRLEALPFQHGHVAQ